MPVHTESVRAHHMISCFHSILIFHMCVLQGPGRHYRVAFCEALSVIVECGGKICGEVYRRGGREEGGWREMKQESRGGRWGPESKKFKEKMKVKRQMVVEGIGDERDEAR